MKTLIVGLDGLSLEMLFDDERLANFRLLMEVGCYGKLMSANPSDPALGWVSLVTGQTPGSLGIDDHGSRADSPNSHSITVEEAMSQYTTIWDQVTQNGGQSILVGVPPSICEGLARVTDTREIAVPPGDPGLIPLSTLRPDESGALVVSLPEDIAHPETTDMERVMDTIYSHIHTRFDTVRQLLQKRTWSCFHFVEPCLPQTHGVWLSHADRQNGRDRPDYQVEDVFQHTYRLLDDELGEVLALLDENTAVLVISVNGMGSPDHASADEGAFILAAPYLSRCGETQGVRLPDFAPTILELGGYSIPASMKGTSLADRSRQPDEPFAELDDEELLRERLSSLGYIS